MYPKENIKLFRQGKFPLISIERKFIIGKDKLIKESFDGNGNIYKSLKVDGMLDNMKNNNIKKIFVVGVDNNL